MSTAYLRALCVAMICNDLGKMACPCSGARGTRVPFNGRRCSQLCLCQSNVESQVGERDGDKNGCVQEDYVLSLGISLHSPRFGGRRKCVV